MTEIRPLEPKQIAELYLIEQAANPYPWSEKVFASCFSERYFSFGIYLQEQLQGFYFGQHIAVEAQLFNICVRVDAQGQGLGAQLLQHFIAQCQQRQVLDAWLEVRESAKHAIQLYQKYGFIETGRRANYYVNAAGREAAVLMALPL